MNQTEFINMRMDAFNQRKNLVCQIKEIINNTIEGNVELNGKYLIQFNFGKILSITYDGFSYFIEKASWKAIFSIKDIDESVQMEEIMKICMIINKENN